MIAEIGALAHEKQRVHFAQSVLNLIRRVQPLRKDSYVGPGLEFFIGWDSIGQFLEIIQNSDAKTLITHGLILRRVIGWLLLRPRIISLRTNIRPRRSIP